MIFSKGKLLLMWGLIAFSAALVSQAGSYLINARLALNETLKINGFIWFTHIRNYGGIFGSFSGRGWWFALFTFGVLTALAVYLIRAKTLKPFQYICLGLLAGGGISNLLDRLIYGSVVDFINLQNIPFWNYIFNTADVMLHLGLWPLLIFSCLNKKEQGS